MHIAVVGSGSKFCAELARLLDSQSHRVAALPADAKTAARLAAEPAQLVVVEGAAKEAGLGLIRALRSQAATRKVPILAVNPEGSVKEVVEYLDSGADDYLARPFNGEVFLARVRTLLRRQIWSGGLAEEPVTVLGLGPLKVHLVERTVRVDGEERALTRLEFDLLAFLLRRKDEVLKRAELLEAVWKYPQEVETRTLDKHVENLRRKLGEIGKRIRTIHGVGYRFLDPQSPLPQSK